MRTKLRAGLGLAAVVGYVAYRGTRPTPGLAGQVAVVTGGSRGLGFVTARELARAGCRVAICGREQVTLDRARAHLAAEGLEVYAACCDVSDREQIGTFLADVTRELGPLDMLVLNAGVIQVGPRAALTVREFEQAMATMYWGVVYPTLAALPAMRQRGRGQIVTISSIGGKVAVPHLLPYTAAKFAATGFSEGLRAEVARDGIRVTTIAPGLMRTGSHLAARFTGDRAAEYRWFALGATLPGISMDVERAARQVVRAVARGEAERTLSIPATLAARFAGVAPGLTANLLAVVNRFALPGPSPASGGVSGAAARRELDSSVVNRLTGLGDEAVRRFQAHEVPRAVSHT